MTDDLIKKLEYWFERCKSFPEETPGGREALLEIRHLVPEVVAALGRADRRVAEEREWAETEACRYASFYPEGSDGRNTFEMLALAIRSRSNDSQPAPSPVGGYTEREVAEVLRAECAAVFGSTWSFDVARRFARAVLTHLSAQRKGSDADVLTARNTVASPISQEGSIAPEALSEASISDAAWKRALGCAARQYECHVRRGDVDTPEQRLRALDDALQHAVGLLSLEACTHPTPLQTGAAGSVPEGYVLVPVEPTREMIAAVLPMYDAMIEDSEWPFTRNLYRAMLAASPSPPVRETVGGIPREPDGYSTDDEGGLLEDLLDECDHGAIIEVTPYWCGEKQWAVVHFDEDGFADHRLFDSADEAEKFRPSTSTDTPTNESEGVSNV